MSNEDLIRKLTSRDVKARRAAAETLARYPAMGALMERDERDISDAVGPLAVALFDEDAGVRKQAARALRAAQRDQQDITAAMPALVRGLSDRRVDVRRGAALILRDAIVKGLDATPFEARLAARLADASDEVKWAAADALAYHYAARERWREVAKLLRHADPDVSQETAGTLAEFWFRFDYRPVAADLVALLSAASLELKLVAAKALVHHPRDTADLAAAFPVLLAQTGHEEARIRKLAVEALGMGISRTFRLQPHTGERERLDPADLVTGALPAIEGAVSDPEGAIQAAAIEALVTYVAALPVGELNRTGGLVTLFEERLRSPHERVQRKAAEALTLHRVRAGQWDRLRALLAGGGKAVQRQILNTLAGDERIRGLGFGPLVPAILDMLSDPDGDLRYAAQRALARVDAAELLGPLEAGPLDTEARRTLLKEVRAQVHRRSLKALKGALEGKSAADRIPLLVAYLGHKKPAVRAWAAESLWWIGQSEDISAAIPPLTRLLHDPDPSARREAAQALGDAAKSGSIQAAHARLVDLTGDASAQVRELAFRALWMSADYGGGDLSAELPALFRILGSDPDAENRGEAAVIISTASRGHDLGAFVPDLVAALEDDFQRVRFYVARALHYAAKGGADIQPAVPALVEALEDEETVASWAVEALLVYAGDAARAAEVLEAARALDGSRPPVVKVVRACEARIQGA
jgi:HEAT repeat protein